MNRAIPTVPLYIRIPIALRRRIEAAARGADGRAYRGGIADAVIRVLDAGLPQIPKLKKRTRKA